MPRFTSILLAGLLPLAAVACAPEGPNDAKTSSSAVTENAGGEAQSYNYLLAEMFMRQVLAQNLLDPKDDMTSLHNQILKVALEGAGDGDLTARAGSVQCERGLGSDYCDIMIGTDVVHPSEEETEAGYTLHVRVYQGTVVSARMELTAG